jgi:Bifunctional DNA primase/polymerase, N-terminal
MTFLDAALDYAARGWPVFPCISRSKEPAVKRGFYAATTNPETVKRYWRQSARNVAIRTGAASGFWVLDVDAGRGGEASLRNLELKYGPLPPTREVITVRGGRHLWFKYVGPISCSADKIAPGLDVRGDGGYAMAPPSIWENGRAYTWSVDSIDEIAPAPDWLTQLACRKSSPSETASISERALANVRPPSNGSAASGDAYGAAALEYEIDELAATAPGSRNHQLNRASFALYQLVGGGELSEAEVWNALLGAATANGLMADPNDGPAKVIATINSGKRAGLQSPRDRNGRR